MIKNAASTATIAPTVTVVNGVTQVTNWNPDGTIQSVQYSGITGQAYTGETVAYGANDKPTSWTWTNGTTVVETAGYNANGQYEAHFFGITNQPYTSYTVVYGTSTKQPLRATYSNGMTQTWIYNSDGSLHESVKTGVTGEPYTSTTVLYESNGKQVSEVFSNGATENWTYISTTTITANVVTLTGIAAPNSTVTISNGATKLGTAAANSTGAWSYTSGPLTDGFYVLVAQTTSGGSNTTSVTAQVKLTLSSEPTLTPIANQAYQATGPNGAVATFAATATDPVDKTDPVVFKEGGTVVHSGNTFSLGTHTITASATDSRGYTTSETFTITVQDTTAPKVSSVKASPAIADDDAGKTLIFTLNMSEIVNVTGTPTLTLNDGGVASYVSGSGTNALTFSYMVAAGQNTSALAISAMNLPNSAAINDIYGTAASLSGALTTFSGLQIDTTAPVAPVISADAVSGSTVILNGTAEANSTVTVFDGTTALGTAATNAGGTWSYTAGALSNGSHGFTATATDVAGNTGTASQAFNLSLGTPQPPGTALLGVNLIGADFGIDSQNVYNKDYIYPTASELDYFKAQGMTLVRLPFNWERMQPTLGGPLDPTELGRLETFMNEAQARGIQVVVDLQNYGRYDGQTIGSAAVPISAFQDFWTKLAGALSGYSNIYGYDIMNEPHDMGDPTIWPAAAQAAVNGIRTVDTTHAVIVEGDDWSSANSWLQYNSNLHINDPANNIIYSAHAYFDPNHSGTYTLTYDQQGANPNIGAQVLAPFESWLVSNNAKGYIGEFGAPGNDPNWLTVLDNFEKTLQQDGIDSTYWAAGPWEGTYPLSVEPVNGEDKAQIADLVKNGEHNSSNPPVITYNPDGSIHDIAYSGLTELQVFGASYTAYDTVYGANGQVVSETFSNGVQESFAYDLDGSPLTATYAGLTGQQLLGESYTSYEMFYAPNGELVSEVFSNGITESMTYDSSGVLLETIATGVTGQAFTSTDTLYGSAGNALSETWRNGAATVEVTTWNADESLHEVVTYAAGGTSTDALYGLNGQLVSETWKTGTATTQVATWNADGSHEIITYGTGGTSTDSLYGSSNQLLSETWMTGTVTTKVATWNADGSHDIATYATDGTSTYSIYGSSNQLLSETWMTGTVTTKVATWNADGSHDIATYATDGTSTYSIYGSSNQLLSETWMTGTVTTKVATWNADGSHDIATYATDGTSTYSVYGSSNQLLSETWMTGTVTTKTATWNADGTHDITTYATDGTSTYSIYGSSNQLLSETWMTGTVTTKTATWNADGTHDITTYATDGTSTYSIYGSSNQLLSETWMTGTVTTQIVTWNSNGFLHEIVTYGNVSGIPTSTDTVYSSTVSHQLVAQEISNANGVETIQGYLAELTFASSALGESVTTTDGQTFAFAKSANTTLNGGGSNANFIVADELGSLAIAGFVPNALSYTNHDTITFGASAFASFSDLLSHTNQAGADTIITDLFGDTLTLKNVQETNLTANDFTISAATSQSIDLLTQYMASTSPTTSGGTSSPTTTTTSQSSPTLLAAAHA